MAKPSILIVEDEQDIRKILVNTFARNSFKVEQAIDGEEGLSIAFKNRPDLILLDILTPKIDGMEVMQKLRQDDWGKNVPIILLTNLSATEEKIIQGITKNEPAYYLVKSDCEIGEIVRKAEEVLKIHKT